MHIVSLLSLCPYVCSYMRPICAKNDFRRVSFEKISVLDSYLIHRYMIIKYRSC